MIGTEKKRQLLHAVRLCRRCPTARSRLAGYLGGEPHAGEGCWDASVVFLGLAPGTGFQKRVMETGPGTDYIEKRMEVQGWTHGPRYFPFLFEHFRDPLVRLVAPEAPGRQLHQHLFFWTDLSRCPMGVTANGRAVRAAEIPACRDFLRRTLELVEPRLVVIVGKETSRLVRRYRLLELTETGSAARLARGILVCGQLEADYISVPQPGYVARFVKAKDRPALLQRMGQVFTGWVLAIHRERGLLKPKLSEPPCGLHPRCARTGGLPGPGGGPGAAP